MSMYFEAVEAVEVMVEEALTRSTLLLLLLISLLKTTLLLLSLPASLLAAGDIRCASVIETKATKATKKRTLGES